MMQRILFVCLGNICRSPAAEAVFLNLIKIKGVEDHYQVDSAGTGAWHVGNQADSRMKDAAKRRGVDTANEIWGNKKSVLVGDFLLAKLLFVFARGTVVIVLTARLGTFSSCSFLIRGVFLGVKNIIIFLPSRLGAC